jgi:hypothetical protein
MRIVLILVCLIVVPSLAGCGSGSSAPEKRAVPTERPNSPATEGSKKSNDRAQTPEAAS